MTVLQLLEQVGAPFQMLEHPEGATALELAEMRGTDPSDGGKSLVMKLEQDFAVVVIPGDGRIEGKALRQSLGIQRYRFASPEELAALTGLQPGEVPPFGRPVFELPLVVDERVLSREQIVFTAGRRDRSLRMRVADWLRAARPDQFISLQQRKPVL